MSLAVGAPFGPYEITAPIGVGGMGEVYRARDPRLNRDVAIKVLPDLFATDPERLSRFAREAQVLAALNHSNIAHIHGIEEVPGAGGRPAVRGLVMEFVDGEDLAARIARGPLPLNEALAIARQVAEALEAAHEQGIVHRDLKPANVMVRADDVVKVLDFGLAKAMGAEASASAAALEHSPTVTSPAKMTHAGLILGTAAYMSPEQARGKPVDRRADVWAFGAVLYEMLTGRRPFEGDSSTDVLGAIVHKEPDWSALPAATPASVRRLLRWCLEKDRGQRLRDIGDARLELDVAREAPEAVVAAPAATWRPVALILAVAVIAVLAGVATGRFTAPVAPSGARAPLRFEIRLPDVTEGVVSPDGSRVVFVAGGRLLVRDLERLETRELAGTRGALKPFWSPDGSTIGYGAAGKLYRVGATGGTPALICNLPNSEWDKDAGGAWRPDDTILFTTGSSGLLKVAAVGGDPVGALLPDPAKEQHFHAAAALPGGRGVLFVVHRLGGGNPPDSIELLADGGRKLLVHAEGQGLANPVYSPSGHILFEREPTNAGVWALPFSLEQLAPTGEPFLLMAGARGHSIGDNGTMVYFPAVEREPVRLTWLNRSGEVVERIGELGELRGMPALSPDGSRVTVQERSDAGWDLWLYHLARGTRTRLTTDGGVLTHGTYGWMPDGRTLLYAATIDSIRTVRRVAADGSGRTEDIVPGWAPTPTPDGKTLIYRGGDRPDVLVRQIDGGEPPVELLKSAELIGVVSPSPDGRWIAHAAVQGGTLQVFVRSFPDIKGRWQVSRNGGSVPRWSADGRTLFFGQDDDVFEVSVQREPEVAFGEPRRLFTRRPIRGLPPDAQPFDVSRDGQRFLVLAGEGEVSRDTTAFVVLHWSPDAEMSR